MLFQDYDIKDQIGTCCIQVCLCNHDNDERKASVDALVARSGYYT